MFKVKVNLRSSFKDARFAWWSGLEVRADLWSYLQGQGWLVVMFSRSG